MKIRGFTIFMTVLFIGLILVNKAYAQDCNGVAIGGQNSILGDLCFNTFPSYRGIASGGLLAAIGDLFGLFLMITGLMWIFSIILLSWDTIRSQGDQTQLQDSMKYVSYFFRGSSLALFTFIIISALGLMAGFGNPFNWGDALYQCGDTNEIYLRGEERLFELGLNANPPTLLVGNTETFYCCNNPNNPLPAGAIDGWQLQSVLVTGGAIPNFCEEFKTTEVRDLR